MPGLHHAVARALRGDGEAIDLTRQADGEIADVDHLLHFAETFGDDLSRFEGDDRAERLLGGAQLLAEEANEFAPARRGDVAPRGEGGFRAADHRRHVGQGRLRQHGDLGPVDRRANDERAAVQFRRVEPRPP